MICTLTRDFGCGCPSRLLGSPVPMRSCCRGVITEATGETTRCTCQEYRPATLPLSTIMLRLWCEALSRIGSVKDNGNEAGTTTRGRLHKKLEPSTCYEQTTPPPFCRGCEVVGYFATLVPKRHEIEVLGLWPALAGVPDSCLCFAHVAHIDLVQGVYPFHVKTNQDSLLFSMYVQPAEMLWPVSCPEVAVPPFQHQLCAQRACTEVCRVYFATLVSCE